MASDCLHSERAVGRWADLPAELLPIISGGLQNPADIIRFRSICRSWRLSTSPPPNKLSPFFPDKLPYTTFGSSHARHLEISASAVYLLRPRRDPSKAFMVSVQEPVAGKLVYRHALTQEEIPGAADDLWPSDQWISQIQIARSYGYNVPCRGIAGSMKAAITILPNDQLVGLCQTEDCIKGFFAIGVHEKSVTGPHSYIVDLVNFKGRIYAVDVHGVLYAFDHAKSELTQLTFERLTVKKRNLVVSEADLYMVVRLRSDATPECFRLVDDTWQRVEDLGGRVLFIAKSCSFSVWARDLPRPWKGNCIVFGNSLQPSCLRHRGTRVFHLGGGLDGFGPISRFPRYSDLFALPNSSLQDQWIVSIINLKCLCYLCRFSRHI